MQAYSVPCWWVGWWLWHAGCISQDTYLLYSRWQLSTWPGPFWFWFIVGAPEMSWPAACPTLCFAASLRFIAQNFKPTIAQAWELGCLFSTLGPILIIFHIIFLIILFLWRKLKFSGNPKQNLVQHIVCGILSRYELAPQSIIAGHPFAFGENEREIRRKYRQLS